MSDAVSKIMYVCEFCTDADMYESCGHFEPSDLRVAPDGRQVCDGCWDEHRYDHSNNADADAFSPAFEELPPITRWQPIPEAKS